MMHDVLPDPDQSGLALRWAIVQAHRASAQAHYQSARAHHERGDHTRLAIALLAARLHIIDALKHAGLDDDDEAAACDITRSLAWKLMGGKGGGDPIGEHLDVLERLIGSLARAESGSEPRLRVADRASD
jgi:hypothetical protein